VSGARGAAVWLLAIGQTLTYAGAYYVFAALLPDLIAATGWSEAQLAAGPTLGFLLCAGLMPVTGRLVDRGLSGVILVALPVVAGLAVAGLALVRDPLGWLALWAVIGVAQAGMLYETCFSHLTRVMGGQARAAITRVTLVAGLASTVSFPLGHWLGEALGGRGALVAFGALVALVAAPVNLMALRLLGRAGAAAGTGAETAKGAVARAIRRPAFWAISGAFGAMWLNHALLITFVLLIFAAQGADPATAALAASCIGPAQVAGRIVLMLNERRLTTGRAAVLALGLAVAAAAVLAMAGQWVGLIFVFALLQGAGAGMLSILRPVLTADHLGRAGFGTVSGLIAVAPTLASAAGPSVGAWAMARGGADLALALAFGLALVATALGGWLALQRGAAE
jgi:MFS family permease